MKNSRTNNYLIARKGNGVFTLVKIENGNIVGAEAIESPDAADTVESLTVLSQKLNAPNYELQICLGEDSYSMIENPEIEPLDEKTFLDNLPFEFKDYINTDRVSDYMFDYVVRGENLDENGKLKSYDIEAIAIESTLYNECSAAAIGISANLVRMAPDIEAYEKLSAIARQKDENADTVCFINVGKNYTDINILHNGKNIFSREIEMGINEDDDDDDIISIGNTLDDLVLEIERTIKRSEMENSELTVGNIYLMGSASTNASLNSSIKEIFDEKHIMLAGELFNRASNALYSQYAIEFGFMLGEWE